jgi:hypothetical protein
LAAATGVSARRSAAGAGTGVFPAGLAGQAAGRGVSRADGSAGRRRAADRLGIALAHPDGCLAYRIDEPATGACLVVATDVEWAAMTPRAQDAFAAFARGADLLAFDAQYRPDEYAAHRGWGHSTWADAAEAARSCGAAKLC